MKQLMILVNACLACYCSIAQTMKLTTDKTTSLIFPYSIRHDDRGTKDVLVQPVKESDNILLVKAATPNFSPTNLSVVTTDGSIYSLDVQYDTNPGKFVYDLPAKKNASLETYTNGILNTQRTMWGNGDRSWNVAASITGIYIKGNIIYYQLRINSQSPIDYDIDFLRFYIRDKKKGKRTAVQENELNPFYMAGNTSPVKAGNKNVIVIALEKFTIPDAKWLAIEIRRSAHQYCSY